MEENSTLQPLDALMNRLGLSNADLVKASTEQLTFKMVHKGRTGRRLTPNVQQKIHNALLAAKPELKIRRRELFRYEPDESFVAGIADARKQVQAGKVNYPQFVDLLAKAGVVAYSVEIAAHRTTYFGVGGEAHEEQGPAMQASGPGLYEEAGIRAAIADAQQAVIDYPTFLKRIYESGIATYEVNVRNRKIVYNGEEESYRENIPVPGEEAVSAPPPASPTKSALAKAKKKLKRNKQVSKTRKARLNSNKRWRQRRKARSGR